MTTLFRHQVLSDLMNGGGAGDVPNEMNCGSLRDIGDCSNELMGMDTSGLKLEPQAPPVKLETVSELCSNCGSFVTVQIDPATADDDDTVFFKCTGCGGQLSYVVEKPKVEPEPKVEIKHEVKTEAPPPTTPTAKSSPQQESPAPSQQQLMSPKSKASSAALRSFRKQKQTVSESTPSQQLPQEKKVGSLTIKPAVSPAQAKPVLSGKPRAFGSSDRSRNSAASKSPPSSLTISNVSNKPKMIISKVPKVGGGKPMGQMPPPDLKSRMSDFELDFKAAAAAAPPPVKHGGGMSGGKPKSWTQMMMNRPSPQHTVSIPFHLIRKSENKIELLDYFW